MVIVKKYMCVGFLPEKEYINDIQSNGFNGLIFPTDIGSLVMTDNKKFKTPESANFNLKQLVNMNSLDIKWSIISVYEEITDELEIRSYKLKKISEKI